MSVFKSRRGLACLLAAVALSILELPVQAQDEQQETEPEMIPAPEAEHSYKLWMGHGITTVRGVPSGRLDFTLDPTFTIYSAGRDVMRARNADWHDKYTLPTQWDFLTPSRESHGAYWIYRTTADEVAW